MVGKTDPLPNRFAMYTVRALNTNSNSVQGRLGLLLAGVSRDQIN